MCVGAGHVVQDSRMAVAQMTPIVLFMVTKVKILKEFLIKKDGQSFVTMKKRNLKLFFKNSNNTNFNTEMSFSSYFRVYFNIELSSFHSQGPY